MKPRIYESSIINNLFKKDEKAVDIPKWIAILFKNIIFKKVPRKDENGRCLKCDARNLCGGRFICDCIFTYQYEKRFIFKWL